MIKLYKLADINFPDEYKKYADSQLWMNLAFDAEWDDYDSDHRIWNLYH